MTQSLATGAQALDQRGDRDHMASSPGLHQHAQRADNDQAMSLRVGTGRSVIDQ